MKCERCRRNEATVHYKAVVQNQVSERRLCQPCAQQLAPFSIVEFLLGGAPPRPREARGLRCRTCQTPYASFQKTWLVGCDDCYASFEKPFAELIPRIQGASRHVGAPYLPQAARRERIAKRRAELASALASEDYEAAARLRDELRSLE